MRNVPALRNGWHDDAVAGKQLMVGGSGSGRDLLSTVDLESNMRPWDYADEQTATRPATLGTKGLLKLLSSLLKDGYRLRDVDFRTGGFEELPEELEQSIGDLLRKALTTEAPLEQASSVLLDNDLLIISVALRPPHGGGQSVQLNRDGQVRFNSPSALNTFLTDIGRALGLAVAV